MSGENTSGGGGSIFDSILTGVGDFAKSITVKDLFAGYAGIEQLKINSGLAKSQNNVAEWNAQAQLLSLQQQQLFNRQQLASQQSLFGGNGTTVAVIAALALVAVGIYVVAK